MLATIENITLGDIGTAIGFLVVLIGGIEFLALRNRKYLKKIVQEETNPLKEELRTNTLNTMKNTICNDNIPLSERVQVGKEYVEKGGNGAVKIYLHKLETEFEKELQKDGKR